MRAPSRIVSSLAWIVVSLALTVFRVALATEPVLPSWNDGASKQAIVDFVKRVTTPGSPDFVPALKRIATFDNDGTLWAEQPLYFQFIFALDRVKTLAPQHPEWEEEEPFKSILKGDMKAFLAGGQAAVNWQARQSTQ